MNDNRNSGGIGFFGVLLIVFIVLKLCDVIQWSWLWVLSPFWIPMGILAAILIIYGCYLLIGSYFRRRAMKRKWGKD